VVEFIKTPGFTIGDAMNLLSKDFDKEKAELIARTEITRAYAWDAQTKGEKQKKEYPDLRVTKTWYTCNDDRVCDICSPLNGKEVDIDKPFTEGVFIPPAHAGCRCWISSSTRILSSPV
jgi:SPP1 gp7 family putative phage head morphogenesis protein